MLEREREREKETYLPVKGKINIFELRQTMRRDRGREKRDRQRESEIEREKRKKERDKHIYLLKEKSTDFSSARQWVDLRLSPFLFVPAMKPKSPSSLTTTLLNNFVRHSIKVGTEIQRYVYIDIQKEKRRVWKRE